MDGPSAYLLLHFSPSSVLVSVVRRFVADFYSQLLSDADATSRLALATHELLENAVKYSTDRKTDLEIEVRPQDGQKLVTIRAENRAEPDHQATLRTLIDQIGQATDVMAFYRERMAEAARRKTGSGLGLARIRAEAEMLLSCEITMDMVVVKAHCCVREG